MRRRVSLLLLLAAWLYECPAAVRVLLAQSTTLSLLTALVYSHLPFRYCLNHFTKSALPAPSFCRFTCSCQMIEQNADSNFLVEGLAAIVFGLCLAFKDDADTSTRFLPASLFPFLFFFAIVLTIVPASLFPFLSFFAIVLTIVGPLCGRSCSTAWG